MRTSISPCIMTMISDFMMFLIFQIFSIFSLQIQQICAFHVIPAALLLIFSLFSLLNLHFVFSLIFIKLFYTTFTSVHIMLIFNASKWRCCRNWKIYWNTLAYFSCRQVFRIFTSINLFYDIFKTCVNNKWCFIRFLILIKL